MALGFVETRLWNRRLPRDSSTDRLFEGWVNFKWKNPCLLGQISVEINILETGDLFINGLYEAVDQTYHDVVPTFMGQADHEIIRSVATNASRHALALRVGKAVVYALGKRVRVTGQRMIFALPCRMNAYRSPPTIMKRASAPSKGRLRAT
jgi:hypothetical protein